MKKREIGVGGFAFGPLEKRYLARVIASNRISYGPFSERFEREFAAEHSCRHGLFLNSGTSALHLALAALKEKYGWKDGDEVLVPAVTFVATANVAFHNRLTPVFIDVDPRTFNIDPAQIEAKITRRTRAVIPVHLLGLPADMDPILEIARRRKLKVVEDSCETVFASYRGRKVGSMGDIGCFSTYVAHYIATGVGGLALTNSRDLAVRLRSLANHGRDSIYYQIDHDRGMSGPRLHELVAKRFSFVSLGHSFRCTEFEAAVGLAQLEQKDAIIRARKANAARLSAGLKGLEEHLQLPYVPEGQEHMFMLYALVLRRGSKTGLLRFLEDRGIETRDLLPILSQPVYRKLYGDLERRYPVARRLNQAGFYIGCHQYLKPGDIDCVVERIRAYFAGTGRRKRRARR